MEMTNPQVQLLFQKVLGQILFYPPNVAGWPGGRSWIDSSSLMFRLRIPQLIKDNENISINTKADDDQQMGMMEGGEAMKKQERRVFGGKQIQGNGQRIVANIDWPLYMQVYKEIPRENLIDVMATVLLQTPDGAIKQDTVAAVANADSREDYIKSVSIALMATPEYQLC